MLSCGTCEAAQTCDDTIHRCVVAP
jgi:hypothetical protein